MQLIEYSAQNNDLAAPSNCRQLQFQREHQRPRSFLLPLKAKLLAPFMIWLLVWNADNSTFSENISANAVFSYLWKPSFWHHLQHEVYVGYREEKHNALKCSLLSIPHRVVISLLHWNADNCTFSENINANAVFSYLWKKRFWHHLQH